MKISINNQIFAPARSRIQGSQVSLNQTDTRSSDTTDHDCFGILQVVAVTDHLNPGPALVDFPSRVSEK